MTSWWWGIFCHMYLSRPVWRQQCCCSCCCCLNRCSDLVPEIQMLFLYEVTTRSLDLFPSFFFPMPFFKLREGDWKLVVYDYNRKIFKNLKYHGTFKIIPRFWYMAHDVRCDRRIPEFPESMKKPKCGTKNRPESFRGWRWTILLLALKSLQIFPSN